MRTPGAETDAKIKHKFADYIRHTMNAASGLPNFVGKVYRGIDAHLKAATYAVGRTITWQSFSSSSRSQMAARGFVQAARRGRSPRSPRCGRDVAEVRPGPGTVAFTGCVLLNLLASAWFDPHSLWEDEGVEVMGT